MKLTSKIYSGILAMLGFSACNPFINITPDMYGTLTPEYGVIHTGYRLTGRVTSGSEPVGGIRITVQTVVQQSPHTIVSVKTGVDGKYVANWEYIDLESLTLIVEDIDGEENGGDFDSQEIKLPAGDSNLWIWDKENAAMTAEVDIELVKKTAEEDENENESE